MAKNVSNLFKEVIQNGGPFYCYADVVLSDGTVLTLDSESDFCIDGNSYEESGGSGFPLGVALSKSINIGILNTDDRFSAYDFYMAKITLYTEADLSDGTKERVKEGTFTVTEPTAIGEIIDIVAYDDMYKSDKEYTPTITFPNTALRTLQDVCTRCDMILGMAEFENSDYQIDSIPENLTCRQVIGYIAMIALGNAMFDVNNRLIIKTYDFSLFETVPIVSGGTLSDDIQDSYSGGTFGETVENYISGGEFGTPSDFHILSEFSTDPDICTDDAVITGIRMDVEDEEGNTDYILYGTRDYALNIDNDLVTGKEQEFTKMVGDKLIGTIIRPFSGTFLPDPTIEFMDCVYVIDRKDNIYQSFICNHSFEYLGNSTFSNQMESPLKNESTHQSAATEAYRKAREQVKKSRTEWEKAMDELTQRVNNSSGLYMTREEQSDGSYIYYMHDKPTLAESMIIWKMTAEAFAVSADGGETYTAGLTVDGTLIAKIMNTIGINFDWGIGGTLLIEDSDGNEVVYMDADTGTVRMKVDSLSIAGKTPQEIAEEQLNDFVDSVYSPAISNLQSQIDGQIETYYYDYQPTLSNLPASEWTTETEREKHEGDLFYWKSKGYSYRFFKDGTTWKWQMVQDTDITKALAAASEAQDTADNKRRVFVITPTPPYDIGDLWVQGEDGDIMRCQVSRQTGSFSSSDWVKASKYTDNAFAEQVQEELQNLQIGGRNWLIGTSEPATKEINSPDSFATMTGPDGGYYFSGKKMLSELGFKKGEKVSMGLDWEVSNATVYGYLTVEYYGYVSEQNQDGYIAMVKYKGLDFSSGGSNGRYTETFELPEAALKAKRLRFRIDNSELTLKISNFKFEKGDRPTDWTPSTEDTETYVDNLVSDLQEQVDGKVQTYNQSSDPSTGWTTTAEKSKHTGDLWYNAGVTKRWSGTTWVTLSSKEAEEAAQLAQSKAQVFTGTPTIPYYKGDLWITALNKTGVVKTCKTTRTSGSYTASDWVEGLKYTDDSAVDSLDQSLDQDGVFNRLTNNGQAQGLYIEDGKLYLNASYIVTGTLLANLIKGGTLTLGGSGNANGVLNILNSSGKKIGIWDNTGIDASNANISGTVTTDNGTRQTKLSGGGVNFFYKNTSCGQINPARYNSSDRQLGVDIESTGKYLSLTLDGTQYLIIGGTSYSGITYENAWYGANLFRGYTKVANSFSVTGTKSRIVNTENYLNRLLYCYEMTSPMFGDIGEGFIDETGECLINIDEIFSETINSKIEYQVFLQKEGEGDLWVEKKENFYFIVKGTPNLKFAWEIKVKQKDYEYERTEIEEDIENVDNFLKISNILEKDAQSYLESMEEILNEES